MINLSNYSFKSMLDLVPNYCEKTEQYTSDQLAYSTYSSDLLEEFFSELTAADTNRYAAFIREVTAGLASFDVRGVEEPNKNYEGGGGDYSATLIITCPSLTLSMNELRFSYDDYNGVEMDGSTGTFTDPEGVVYAPESGYMSDESPEGSRHEDMVSELVDHLLCTWRTDTYRPQSPCTYAQWSQLLTIIEHEDLPPACFAAQNTNVLMLEDLLSENPDCLSLLDSENNNALHYLSSTFHGEKFSTLHLLLDNGVDPLAKNNDGVSAFDLFMQCSKQSDTNKEINAILEKNVLDQTCKTNKRKDESQSMSL